MTRPQLNK